MGWTIRGVQTFIRFLQGSLQGLFSESAYITAYNFCHKLRA